MEQKTLLVLQASGSLSLSINSRHTADDLSCTAATRANNIDTEESEESNRVYQIQYEQE